MQKVKAKYILLGLLAYMVALAVLFSLGGALGFALALASVLIPLILLVSYGLTDIMDKLASISVKKSQAEAARFEAYKIKDDTAYIALPQRLANQTVIVPLAARPHLYKTQMQVSEVAAPALIAPIAQRVITAQEALQTLKRNSMQWCFGVDEEGNTVTRDIAKSVHVLNVAATGMGKTSQTANMLYQLTQGNDADYFSLLIADLKGDLIDPFAPYAVDTGMQAADYCRMMRWLRQETDRRIKYNLKNGHTIIAVFEEALAIRANMTKEQLTQYAIDMEYVAITSRAYNIFMVACMQVDYATQEFRASRQNFLTKLGGAVMPKAAESMGFLNTELVKKVFTQKKPGQFLIEGPDGARIIQAPIMDLRRGDLHRLLNIPMPDNQEQLRKSQEDEYIRRRNGNQSTDNLESWLWSDRDNHRPTSQKCLVLPEPEDAMLVRAWKAYQAGNRTIREFRAAMEMKQDDAIDLLRLLKRRYRLD